MESYSISAAVLQLTQVMFILFINSTTYSSTLTGNSISCFSCESSEETFSEQCVNNVAEARKYIQPCANHVTRCFALITSQTDIIRGCFDTEVEHGKTCARESPYCNICGGSLCNKWNVEQSSELMCSFCRDTEDNDHNYDNSCSSGGEDTLQCPIITTQGRNIYCFTAFRISTGRVVERGCMEDNKPILEGDIFYLTCAENYCNKPQMLDKFSCHAFNGFKSKLTDQKMRNSVACNKNLKSYVPGCYTIMRGKKIEMGCNSLFSMRDFATLYQWSKSAVQFCFRNNCNSVFGKWPLKDLQGELNNLIIFDFLVNRCRRMQLDNAIVDLETCKETKTRCFIRPGEISYSLNLN